MDDLEYVLRCVKGDRRSWDEFVTKYSRLIYSYIHSVLRLKPQRQTNQEHVNDIFQEIFVLLSRDNFRKLRSFKAKNGCSLASWLRQVVINYTIDYLRKAKFTLSLDEENEDGFALGDIIPDQKASAPKIAEFREKMQNLKECIGGLQLDDKLFLELHVNQDVGMQDLMALFKVTRGAIDMRKARIIERLRECFRSKGFVLDL